MSKREAPSDDRDTQRRAGVVRELNPTQVQHVNAALNQLPRYAVTDFAKLETTATAGEIKVTNDGGPVKLKTEFGSCKLFFPNDPTKPDETRGEFVITLSPKSAANANAVCGLNGGTCPFDRCYFGGRCIANLSFKPPLLLLAVIVKAITETKNFFPKKGFGDMPKLNAQDRFKRIDMDLQSVKPAYMFKNPKTVTIKSGTEHEKEAVQYSIKLNFVADGKPGPTEARICEAYPDLMLCKHLETKRINPMLDRIFCGADGKQIAFEDLLPHLVALPSCTFLPLEAACEIAVKGVVVSEKYNRIVLSSFLNRCTVSGVPASAVATGPSEDETAAIDAIYASSTALTEE